MKDLSPPNEMNVPFVTVCLRFYHRLDVICLTVKIVLFENGCATEFVLMVSCGELTVRTNEIRELDHLT